MLRVAEKKGYILYYDTKYDEFLVVTPNYKITRYWRRLSKDLAEYFDEQVNNYKSK